jgi:hypothetical protein
VLTGRGDHAAALPVWERFLALGPTGRDARQARQLATLCRLSVRDDPDPIRAAGEG